MPNSTCIITGATRGIGRATALRFAADGWNVVIAARHAEALEQTAEAVVEAGGSCLPLATDVGRPAEVRRLVTTAHERFGRIDVLVNNAGVAPLGTIDEITPEAFDQVYEVNIAAIYHATRAVWPLMQDQGGGLIVNLSSLASVDPFRGFAVYGASKAWVNLFSQAMAAEGRPHGIRVFAVAPGAVETELMRSAFPDFPVDKALAPDDVAAVIASLWNAGLSPCSGQTLFVRK